MVNNNQPFRRFLDPVFDQSASDFSTETGEEYAGLENPNEGKALGEMVTTGEKGFRSADTPQCWVFIEKKQWTDETWTYVVPDSFVNTAESLLENAKGEVSRLKGELTAKTQVGDDISGIQNRLAQAQAEVVKRQTNLDQARQDAGAAGGRDPVDGKLFQIDIRRCLGNIITRKLDWMNDHEKFTKVTTAVNETIDMLRQNGDKFSGDQASEKKRIANIKAAAAKVNASQTATEATAKIRTQIDLAIQSLEIQNGQLLEQAKAIQAQGGSPEDLKRILTQLTQNTDRIKQLTDRKDKLIEEYSTDYSDLARDLQDLISFEFAPVTLSGNAFTRYYRSPKWKDKDTDEVIKLKDQLAAQQKVAQSLEQQINSKVNPPGTETGPQQQYARTQMKIADLQDKLSLARLLNNREPDNSGETVFNGIIELANVASVNTSISLDGEGSANFTIENPQNIFYISDSDITLALSESQDPFLEANNGDTTLVSEKGSLGLGQGVLTYFRGRWYPSDIISMLTRGRGAAIDTGHLTQFTATANKQRALTNNLSDLQELAANLNSQINALDAAGLDSSNESVELGVVEDKIASVTQALASAEALRDQEKSHVEEMRSILTRYYVGKTIFEVLDRVYIWMTSPTRTPFRTHRDGIDKFAIEDPSVIAQAQRVAKLEDEISALQEEIYTIEVELNIGTDTPVQSVDYSKLPSYIVLDGVTIGSTEALTRLDKDREKVKTDKALLEVIRRQLATTDSVSGSQTFSTVPTRFRDSTSEGEYEMRNLGIEEQRLQVFQGVIAGAKHSFNGSTYQIEINCKDNLVFLTLSRIMIKPALRTDNEPVGILENPIWRSGVEAGSWKSGILVLDHAFINDEVQVKIDKKRAARGSDPFQIVTDGIDRAPLPYTEGRKAVSPYVTSLPFARVDAADLVSFIITGVPYDFAAFVKNAVFGGRLLNTRKQGETAQVSDEGSFFAYLKRSIGEQNDRLGDFEPYIALGNKTAEELTNDLAERKTRQDDAQKALTEAYKSHILNAVYSYLKLIPKSSSQPAKPGQKSPVVVSEAEKARAKEALDIWMIVTKQETAVKDSAVQQLIDIVLRSAGESSSLPSVQEQGLLSVSDEDVDSVVKTIISPKVKSDKDLFGGVVNIIQHRDPNQNENGKDKRTQDAVASFVRTNFLTLDIDFRTSYQEAVVAINEFKNFNEIYPLLVKYVTDVDRVLAVKRSGANALQSSIEKIIRQEKKNFLVISDSYQLDTQLQAYQTEVGKEDFVLFQSEFESPLSVCKRAADQVDFEFFADSQGNIQFRPPTYNRILKEHFDLIAQTDNPARRAILIRYGSSSGLVLQAILKSVSLIGVALTEYAQKRNMAKLALTNEQVNIARILYSSNLDDPKLKQIFETERVVSTSVVQGRIDELNKKISEGISSGAVKGVAERHITKSDIEILQEVRDIIDGFKRDEQTTLAQAVKDAAEKEDKARSDLLTIEENFVSGKITNKEVVQGAATDYIAVLGNTAIQQYTGEIALYDKIIVNLEAIMQDLANRRSKAQKDATEFINRLDSFFDEHRIHRIHDQDLMNYNLAEGPPRFTRLDVVGAPELVQVQGPEYYWSGGVDYDMWRNYGFMSESVQRAYFHSGATAKVYCRALLGRERGRIFSGTITVRGDSKYQLGDCIFLEATGMYYYITGISIGFQYGQTYQVTLTLAFGRRIGELIPHPFDVLGAIVFEAYQSDLEYKLANEKYVKQNQQSQQIQLFEVGAT